MAYLKLNLQLFGDGGGAGAGAAAAAGGGTGAGDGGEAAVMSPGTLNDGTVVDDRLAARLEEQARKRRNRGEAPVQVQTVKAAQPEQAEAQAEPAEEESLEEQWLADKKGKYRDQYARDVQAAVQDRFKNQKDANDELARIQPALKLMARKMGLEEDDTDGLIKALEEDDSLWEEEAEKAGMTVEGFRNYQEMLAENERLKAQEAEEQEQMFLRQHFQKLADQAEKLKAIYPNFDLRAEMENETFRRLVAPNSGLDVQAAYFAVHHAELEPQAMAYGIQRAQQQMAQTLAANRARPVEGAMKSGSPADVSIDPRSLTRAERQKLIERARRGEKIII